MKLIKLTRGLFAQVDNWNYAWLNQWKWFALKVKNKDSYYAVRSIRLTNGKQGTIYMHRLIMNTPDDKEVDHQDHNRLNCQEYNMRNCTHQQNQMNQTSRGNSKYLGVSYVQGKYIQACIKVNGKNIYLGISPIEIEAAKRYDAAAKYYFGEFANLNFK